MKRRKHNSVAASSDAGKTRRFMLVVYPDAHILDAAGPLDVLTGAGFFLPDDNTPYETFLFAHQSGVI